MGRRIRAWHRLLARCLAMFLDARLAAGRSPETALLLAVRARALVDAAYRERLVRDWENLLDRAHGRPGFAVSVPIRQDRVLTAEGDIHGMLGLLLAPLPVPARGVALAGSLLTDGTGPLYNPANPADVAEAVRDATHHLDPSTELV